MSLFHHFKVHISHFYIFSVQDKKADRATAKMTAWCAPYMGDLKILRESLPEYAHGYFCRNLQWAFVPIDPMKVRTKFEVRSFTNSWDNRGTQKFGQSLDTPTLPLISNFNGLLFGWTLWIYLPNLQTVRSSTRSWDNRWYSKNLGSCWIRLRSLFCKIFHRPVFGWTL